MFRLIWNILMVILGSLGLWVILLGIFAITGTAGWLSAAIVFLFALSVIQRFVD